MTDSAFESLLKTEPAAPARERLHEARRELALGEDDALWGLLRVVKEYRASLGPAPAPAPAPAPPPAATPGPRWVFEPWQLVCAGLGAQAIVLAFAFFVGRNWGYSLPPNTDWMRTLLGIPAGWMVFLLALPALIQGAVSSWHVRQRDGVTGWCLFCAFSIAIAVSAASLVWLLF